MIRSSALRRRGASARRPRRARRASAPPRRARAGFALITVLWLITVLYTVVALGLGSGRLGQQASTNRVTLRRASWAAAACIAIAHARWPQGRGTDTTTIDLGRTAACRWRLEDPTARVNVNVAPKAVLLALLGDSVAGAAVERRNQQPIVDPHDLSHHGELSDEALDLLTVDGPGTINANAAPSQVLRAVPGLTPEAVERLLADRLRSPPRTLDALVAAVSPSARAALLEHYAELARMLTFAAPQYVLTARGWVGKDPERLAATIEQAVVPLPERLAVIRQRVRG